MRELPWDICNYTQVFPCNTIIITMTILGTDNEPEQPSQDAISWETFFMRIALLSKTRPGEYDTQPDKAVSTCTCTFYI